MHLGLARAQLLPRSDGYRRFTGSPIDALVYLVGCYTLHTSSPSSLRLIDKRNERLAGLRLSAKPALCGLLSFWALARRPV
jgi:hypothetical protein